MPATLEMTIPQAGTQAGTQAGSEADSKAEATQRPIVVIINRRAGEVLQVGEDVFAERLRSLFAEAGAASDIRLVSPKELDDALDKAVAVSPRAVVVAGGDGTVCRLLPRLLEMQQDHEGVPVGILPLGTWNLLARDVGLDGSEAQNVAILARGQTQPIDLGEINGKLFHSNVGLGFFAMMAREREQARRRFPFSKALSIAFAGLRTFLSMRAIEIEIEIDGKRSVTQAEAVLVTNNHFAGTPWRRASLNSGLLEVHMLQSGSVATRLKVAVAVYRGRWRDLPNLQSVTVSCVTLRRRGSHRCTIAIDGEIDRVTNPLRLRSHPGALSLIGRPASDPAAPTGMDAMEPGDHQAGRHGPGSAP